MTKGRWLVMAFSFCLKFFLVLLASQLELFMSFLFPKLHPFFLILLPCHLSALRSCHFVGPSTSPIVLCLKLWFVFTNDFLMMRAYDFKFVEQDLSLLLACLHTIESRRWGCRQLYVLFLSTFLDLRWFFIDERLFIGAIDSISSIHDEWVVSSLRKVIAVHHVSCFISDWIHLVTYPN
jgi:hypothetical protein